MAGHPPPTLREDFWDDPGAVVAQAALMREVFGIDLPAQDALCGRDPTCRRLAFFDAGGTCVASAETFALRLRLDGTSRVATAIARVAVAEAWRGRGLFRALMVAVLARCDAEGSSALLYAEHAALYTRFGFRPVPQHKIVGPPPLASGAFGTARPLDLENEADFALLFRLLAGRCPVSDRVAVEGGGALFLSQVGEFDLAYSTVLDAAIAFEVDAEVFRLVDVAAARMPPLAALLATLGRVPARVEVLFPPDKLGWDGAPAPDDTGLMLRGPEPAAFGRPFMLPPTTGF